MLKKQAYPMLGFTGQNNAKPYVSSIDAVSKDIYIIVSKKNIVSVDGITKRSDTESMVEYSYTFEQTPIGKAFLTNESDLGIIKKGRAHFVLFDDGWKVESPLR